ncbi:MAG: methyltransferase domain-containing protein [Pirellulales bacterium]|nr:methyltransferase domain-containing protein [Pirellulales bacterium]
MWVRAWFMRLTWSICLAVAVPAAAQETSVRPGINDSFRDPDLKAFEQRFETESREVFALRHEIVAACKLQPGQVVADVGAGTGLFTLLMARAVGSEGKVLAVDIAEEFLEHIQNKAREAQLDNVTTVLCKQDSAELAPASVDVVFVCDTYHHFEFPFRTLQSLHRALRPGGRLIVIDFRKVAGESTEFVMQHVRAPQDVFEQEIADSGFQKVDEVGGLLKENYFVVFQRQPAAGSSAESK